MPQSPTTSDELAITPAMVEAGVRAVREVIGAEDLYRGEAAKVAEGVYKAMESARKSC